MSEKKRIYVIFDHSADMLTFSEIKSSCNAEDCGNYFYTIDYSDDYNNEIKAYLVIAVKRSLFNLMKIGNGLLEINLRKDKIIVTDKYTKKIVFESNHLLDLEIPNLVSYLLEFVSKHNDIRINYQFNKPVSTDITVFNTHVSFTGDEKNVFPIIISCADCKEILKNVNCHQLKLEDFKYEK